MTKVGKLGKLLKKMQSMGRSTSFNNNHHYEHTTSLSRRSSTSSSTIVASKYNNNNSYDDDSSPEPFSATNLCPVYVGKSRRRYLVSSEVLDHPLFRELIERSSSAGGGGGEEVSVGCEVVLFEHMLWMLENADPQPESLDELVDFYAC
ncbi:auxin-responsive protein SAUR78-like [Spinacia oleracea]|uniref:Auxin-responsive protein SAUR78-like n=1 Tax=Spinacia oleracea TaxID=3562 RepID=A0A9R0IH49_SPIOL|nr:auxin-responsive protein SAUR78-like [Spinacia oleracea]